MIDDPIVLLESELVGAARRRAASGPPRRRRGVPLSTLAALTLAALSLAIGAGALILLSGHRAASRPAPITVAPTIDRGFTGVLAVLRRPQTGADRTFQQRGWPQPPKAAGSAVHPVRSLIRLATVTPWGAKVFVVPLSAPASPALRQQLGPTVTVWVQDQGWSGYATLDALTTGNAWGPGGPVTLPSGRIVQRFFELVPDGVAKVVFEKLRSLHPLRFRGSVTAVVHHNIAAFQVNVPESQVVIASWYGADGRVLRKVGAWNVDPALAPPA